MKAIQPISVISWINFVSIQSSTIICTSDERFPTYCQKMSLAVGNNPVLLSSYLFKTHEIFPWTAERNFQPHWTWVLEMYNSAWWFRIECVLHLKVIIWFQLCFLNPTFFTPYNFPLAAILQNWSVLCCMPFQNGVLTFLRIHQLDCKCIQLKMYHKYAMWSYFEWAKYVFQFSHIR